MLCKARSHVTPRTLRRAHRASVPAAGTLFHVMKIQKHRFIDSILEPNVIIFHLPRNFHARPRSLRWSSPGAHSVQSPQIWAACSTLSLGRPRARQEAPVLRPPRAVRGWAWRYAALELNKRPGALEARAMLDPPRSVPATVVPTACDAESAGLHQPGPTRRSPRVSPSTIDRSALRRSSKTRSPQRTIARGDCWSPSIG